MKKTSHSIYAAVLATVALSLASCTSDEPMGSGEGSLKLSTSVSTDVKVVSRATEQELIDKTMVWISNEKGLVRRYNAGEEIPSEIKLLAGHYTAEAWTGDSASASWVDRYFKGREEFDVTSGRQTAVNLVCKIANVVVSVNYQEGLENLLGDISMEVGHSRGSLAFDDAHRDAKGYFMMPSTDTDLTYTLRGTQIDGSTLEFPGTIANAEPATEYVLNVKYAEGTSELGGATFTIIIDKKEIEVSQEENLVAPPKLEGYGFKLADAITGEKGTIGRTSVYVTSANKINNLLLSSDYLATISEFTEIDLLQMSEEGRTMFAGKGINYVDKTPAGTEGQLIQLNFEEILTKSLDNGEYAFDIVATDNHGQSSRGTLKFVVSDAPVVVLPVEESAVSFDSAVLRGQVAKDGTENVGFRYRQTGTDSWTEIEGTAVSRALGKGAIFEATVTGLNPSATYEYVALCDGFVTTTAESFSTLTPMQLPNASFEEWDTSGKAYLIHAPGGKCFWDSGNHGSATMNKNVTTPGTEYAHSGSRSVKLSSQFVGIGKIGKFAAGNIFIGQYLETLGADGATGFGRPISDCVGSFWKIPTAVRLWVKYVPGKATKDKGAGDKVPEGTLDSGQIFVGFSDDSVNDVTTVYDGKENKGTVWSAVVNTKTQQFFNKDAANIVAFGERIFDAATEGDGLVEITIPLEVKKNVTPTRIFLVAAASRYGDYFQGGEGSTMWIDDVELVY